MESELPRTQGHHYESTDLSGVEGHSEGHHEKTSVLKKVKAKATKIKNTLITKHGHEAHDSHEYDHDHDHSRDESQEDEDEGMVEDPEIHGAPVYESAAVKSATPPASGGQPSAGETNLDRPSMAGPHYDTPIVDPQLHGAPVYESAAVKSPTRASGGQPGAGETNLDRPSMAGPHNDTPIVDPETRPFVQWQADEEQGKHLLQEDKHAPLPSKRDDARTGDGIYPESPHKGIKRRTGRDTNEEKENQDQVGAPEDMEGIRGGIGPNIGANPSSGRGSEETEGITPVIQSFNKMGISEKTTKPEQGEGLYTGSHDQFAPESMPHESSDSVPKSYNAANPQDMPRDTFDPASQSRTYTKRITSASAVAASTIAGTAQSAKNVIASKIGQMREPGEGNKSGTSGEGTKSGTSVMGTASDYANKMAATVTDKLAPVYGKVVGVGSTDKVSGIGAENARKSGANVEQDKGVSAKAKEYWVEKLKPGEEDKVLSTMITESFSKPNGEKMEEVPSDNGGGGHSISQTVSDDVHKLEPEESEEGKPMGKAVHKREPEESEVEGKPMGKAVHKREPEESEEEGKPMGKVTESEEVAKRLGTGEEGSGLENIGSGAGVVNKLTGAIGSWFGGQGGLAKSTPGTTLAGENEGDMGKNA